MKVTLATMKNLIKNIENATSLQANNCELSVENNEYSLSFCAGNDFIISCYVFDNTFQIGYLLKDGVYYWHEDINLKEFASVKDFIFFIVAKLKEIENYIVKYVLV